MCGLKDIFISLKKKNSSFFKALVKKVDFFTETAPLVGSLLTLKGCYVFSTWHKGKIPAVSETFPRTNRLQRLPGKAHADLANI